MPLSLKLAALAAALAAAAALAQPPAPREVAPTPAGDFELALEHDGRTRTALVHVPEQAGGGRPLPVVLNFHGSGGNARDHREYVRMDTLADREGFIVVYPNGTGWFEEQLLTWNAGLCCGYAVTEKVDDVGFVRALLDALGTRAPVDPARVYATGLANGAMMSYRLAAQASDRIAAIAPVGGSMVLPERRVGDARPSLEVPGRRPVPIMHVHSVDDPRAVYQGGLSEPVPLTSTRTRHPNAEEVLYRWVAFAGAARSRRWRRRAPARRARARRRTSPRSTCSPAAATRPRSCSGSSRAPATPGLAPGATTSRRSSARAPT
jgi:polyhydroxybutyrate depolymerase